MMTYVRVVPRLLLVASTLLGVPLHAQCSPAAQRQITERRFAEARNHLQALVKRNPRDHAAMNCLGRVLLNLHEEREAVAWMERAVEIDARNAQHQLWLGNALLADAQEGSTLRRPFLVRRMRMAFDQAVALDPTLVDARLGLVLFHSLAPAAIGGSMSVAREQATAVLGVNPMRGHIALGTIAEREKAYSTAEKQFSAAIAARPDSATAYTAAASYYRRRRRWTEAIAIYERQLVALPSATDARLGLAEVFIVEQGQYDRGEREVRLWLGSPRADGSDTKVSLAHYLLGVVHERGSRPSLAKQEYRKALTANPRNESARKALESLR